MEVSSLYVAYSLELKGLMDIGDYFLRWKMSFNTSKSSSYHYSQVNQWAIEKSFFPDDKLLAWFEETEVKFPLKDENAIVFQFERSILSFSLRTYGLVTSVESNYAKGEIMHIIDGEFFFWEKNGKSVDYKRTPINFVTG